MKEIEKIRKVIVSEYDPIWVERFTEEASLIKRCLKNNCLAVHHIGSTSIEGLAAKPVVDILVIVDDLSLIDDNAGGLQSLGYVAMGEYGIPGRRFFWKTPEQRLFHVHLFEKGHADISRHLAFRDYMREHRDVACAYGEMKRALAKQFVNDIEGYVNGKDSFIRTILYWSGVAKQDQLEARDDVILEPHNRRWKLLANAEIEAIDNTVGLKYHSINHLGSTAITDMSAKPIIDLFIGLDDMRDASNWVQPLHNLGYIFWKENPEKQHGRYFKGMPPYGIARTHHLHIMPQGPELERRILFKTILNRSATTRQQYLALKQKLAQQYANDREQYTREKSAFITSVIDNPEEY